MKWTRISFFYLIGYLLAGGLGLIVAPALAAKLLGSTATYSPALLRMSGALLVALGIFVLQMRRHRSVELYPTTLVARLLILAVLGWAYLESRDPMFLVLIGIVGLGVALTGLGMLADRASIRVAS
jgi:uncharacterized protein YjeT (DUF2065 family)